MEAARALRLAAAALEAAAEADAPALRYLDADDVAAALACSREHVCRLRGAGELELLASVERSMDALALTPASAATLGVDLVRGESLVEAMDEAPRIREEAEQRHSGGR
jgi:hypothetical protein